MSSLQRKIFKQASVQKTKLIEILDFTDESQVDTMYFDKPYYLQPDKGAGKAYVLLNEALKKLKNRHSQLCFS